MSYRKTDGTRTKRENGATTIEFAMVAVLFFGLLFAIIDWGVLWWVNGTMQHAVREGTRYAITGQVSADPDQDDPQRYLAVIEVIKQQSMGLFDDVVNSVTIGVYDPVSGIVNYTEYDEDSFSSGMFGAPGDTMVIVLNCTWRPMTFMVQPVFQNGEFNFTVSATMRNELFPQ